MNQLFSHVKKVLLYKITALKKSGIMQIKSVGMNEFVNLMALCKEVMSFLRCVIPVVCRINQTIWCKHISSDTTMY